MTGFTLPEKTLRRMVERRFHIGLFDGTITERWQARGERSSIVEEGDFPSLAEALTGALRQLQERAYRDRGRDIRARPGWRQLITPKSVLRREVIAAGANFDTLIEMSLMLDDEEVDEFVDRHKLDIRIKRWPRGDLVFEGELLPIGTRLARLRTSVYGPPELSVMVVSDHKAVFPWGDEPPVISHCGVDANGRSLPSVTSEEIAIARREGTHLGSDRSVLYLDIEAAKAAAIEACRVQIRGIEAMIDAFGSETPPSSGKLSHLVIEAQRRAKSMEVAS